MRLWWDDCNWQRNKADTSSYKLVLVPQWNEWKWLRTSLNSCNERNVILVIAVAKQSEWSAIRCLISDGQKAHTGYRRWFRWQRWSQVWIQTISAEPVEQKSLFTPVYSAPWGVVKSLALPLSLNTLSLPANWKAHLSKKHLIRECCITRKAIRFTSIDLSRAVKVSIKK